jgi:hypothetical protein
MHGPTKYVWNSKGKKQLESFKFIWEGNTRIDLRGKGCKEID